MDIFKLSASALITLFLCVLIKRYNPEYAVACGMLGCVVIFYFAADGIKEIFRGLFELFEQCGIKSEYLVPIIKITGIAFLGQICASLCRDAGETALASNVELCANVIILVLGLPIIKSLFSLISSLAGLVP